MCFTAGTVSATDAAAFSNSFKVGALNICELPPFLQGHSGRFNPFALKPQQLPEPTYAKPDFEEEELDPIALAVKILGDHCSSKAKECRSPLSLDEVVTEQKATPKKRKRRTRRGKKKKKSSHGYLNKLIPNHSQARSKTSGKSTIREFIEYGKTKKPSIAIPCKFFLQGKCKMGVHCRFSHVHFYPMPTTFHSDQKTKDYLFNNNSQNLLQKPCFEATTQKDDSRYCQIVQEENTCPPSATEAATTSYQPNKQTYESSSDSDLESSSSTDSLLESPEPERSSINALLEQLPDWKKVQKLCSEKQADWTCLNRDIVRMEPGITGSDVVCHVTVRSSESARCVPAFIGDSIRTQVIVERS